MRPKDRIRAQQQIRIAGRELPLDSPILDKIEAERHAAYLARRNEMCPPVPAAQRSPMGEKEWQGRIVAIAVRFDYWTYHPLRSKGSAWGWPDLSLLGRRPLWIEVKSDENNLTEEQVDVISRMRTCGLEVHVVRPSDGEQWVMDLLASATRVPYRHG